MSGPTESNDLDECLPIRRVELRLKMVGLPTARDARRGTADLRREGIAVLASISLDYYARIEQSRRASPWPTLAGEPSVLDTEVRRWWSDHQAAARARGTRHPVVGELGLGWETLTSTSHTYQQLVYLSPPAGTESRERPDRLAREQEAS